MRRIFTNTPDSKRASLEEAALKQLRETRAKISQSNPDLLDTIRNEIFTSQSKPALPPKSGETIDKQKNIQTVLKFLQEKDANPAMDQAIKAILAQH